MDKVYAYRALTSSLDSTLLKAGSFHNSKTPPISIDGSHLPTWVHDIEARVSTSRTEIDSEIIPAMEKCLMELNGLELLRHDLRKKIAERYGVDSSHSLAGVVY